MRFSFDPSSGIGPDKVFAFETPVESLIKIMENAEIAHRLEQVTGLLEARGQILPIPGVPPPCNGCWAF